MCRSQPKSVDCLVPYKDPQALVKKKLKRQTKEAMIPPSKESTSIGSGFDLSPEGICDACPPSRAQARQAGLLFQGFLE